MASIHEFQPQRNEKQLGGLREDRELESQFRAALVQGNRDALKRMKRAYEERYPHEQESIEALFGLSKYLDTSRTIREIKERDGSVPKDLYRAQTEYNFTLTHFVKVANDKEFLSGFWGLLGSVGLARGTEDARQVEHLRAGIVTQVAISKTFEALGEGTSISHPDEDAFRATDLWVEEHPVQVKGVNGNEPQFTEVDTMTYPATSVRHGNRETVYSSHFDKEIDRFGLKIRKYGDMKGVEMHGYFVAVPYRMIDLDTGDPSPELIEYFREHSPDKPNPAKKAA
jgi:hypothetical protein